MRAEITGTTTAPLPRAQVTIRRSIDHRLRWLVAAILGWALVYLFVYVPGRGNGSDFQVFYAAAYADAHGIDVYSWPALWRAEQILYNGGAGHATPFAFAPYGNPPLAALLLRPFTALPEAGAYRLWAALVLATTACGAYLGLASWPRAQRIAASVLVTLSPAALFNVRLGQSAGLLVFSLGASLWLLHARRPALAGAALSLGLVKPHLAIPISLIVIFAAQREQRRPALLGFLVATTVWGALAALADGVGIFARWWASIHNFLGSIRLQPDVASIPGFYYGSAPERAIGPLNDLCLLLAALIIVALARRAWSGGERARMLLFGGGIAAYFALSPYVHTGDQVVLALPLLALIGPDARGLRHNGVLLAATAAILAPMVVFRDYHTEIINALPPLCLGLAYALWNRNPDTTEHVSDAAGLQLRSDGSVTPGTCKRVSVGSAELVWDQAAANHLGNGATETAPENTIEPTAVGVVPAMRPQSQAPVRSEALAGRIKTPWRELIMAALALRILVSLVGAGIMLLLPRPGQPHDVEALLLAPWRHFDAIWFTQIAAHGYASSPLTTAYMPLYPLLIHIAAVATGGHYLTAALIVSNLSLVAAVGAIWRWVAEAFSPRVAWRTVALLLTFPDAFFLVGAYSESTFLALSAACLLALRHERPLLAGTLALLATLTRLQGLVLTVPLLLALRPYAVALLRQWLGRPRSHRHPASPALAAQPATLLTCIGAALPLLGFALYQRLLTTSLHGGSVLATYRDQWHIPLQAPWQTIWQYVTVIRSPQWHLFHSPQYNYILLWYLLIALIALGVLVATWRRLGWELTVFGLAGWCFLMTRWYSTGRYMLSVLPLFVALALWTEGPRRLRWLTVACVLVLVFFTAEFAQNSWVD